MVAVLMCRIFIVWFNQLWGIVSTLGGEEVVLSDELMCTLETEGWLDCFVGIGTLIVTFDSVFFSDAFLSSALW